MYDFAEQGIDPSQFSEEELRQLMEAGIIPEENQALESQIAQAQALRDESGPKGRYFRGSMYQAANPLEHIAKVGQDYMAGKQQADLRAQQAANRQQQVDVRTKYIDALRGRPGQGANPSAGGPVPPKVYAT